jgi:hypothetical protein
MRDLEEELRRSLKRVDPAPDFAERVLWKVEIGESPPEALSFKRRPIPQPVDPLIWLAAACILVAVFIVGVWSYARHQRRDTDTREATLPVQPNRTTPAPVPMNEPGNNVKQMPAATGQGLELFTSRDVRPRHKSNARVTARAEGLRAKRELMAALYVASAKLNFAESRVRLAMSGGQHQGEELRNQEPER